MSIRFDWKFGLTLLLALASVLVPVWLWQADLSARSLHIKKVSQTSLQPPDSARALSLTISLAGAELPTPYLTVFELVNDGAKPVPSSDFESSIEIAVVNKANIVRTSVTSTNPRDLSPDVSLDAGIVKIKPMLLNPGDSTTFAVLTSGEEPVFASRARIAGVPSVSIDETTSKAGSPTRTAALALVALIFFVVASLTVDGWPLKGSFLRARASFVVSLSGFAAGATLAVGVADSLGYEGFWPAMALAVVGLVIAGFVSSWLNAAEKSTFATSKAKSESTKH